MTISLWAGALSAAQGFLIFGVIRFVYGISRRMLSETDEPKPLSLILMGFLACALVALVAASELGQASCDELRDANRTSCKSYADNGFVPTNDERTERFAYIFLLLYTPALAAVLNHKLRRPVIGSSLASTEGRPIQSSNVIGVEVEEGRASAPTPKPSEPLDARRELETAAVPD